MSVDKKLLNRVMNLTKEAYVPPGAPPMDPSMMGGAPPMDPSMMGGAPPMDPSMMGGAPPMDPAMMGGAPPMDPSMMGAPPMDPSMMGAPPMDPSMMDPAMMGGAPPGDPAAGGMPIMLNMADLEAILAQAGGKEGGPEGESKRVTNRDIGERLDQVEMILAHMANHFQIPLPEGGIGAPTEESELPPMGEEFPEEASDPFTAPAESAMGPAGGMPDPMGGLMPGAPSDAAMMPPASIKTAAADMDAGKKALMDSIRLLNNYRS